MEDNTIIDLYWERSEEAISVTVAKYGGYCYSIAYNILYDKEDSEESVNDTWLAAWNTMPPKRPQILSAFLGKITRYISLDRWKNLHATKRGGGMVPLVLDELEECVSNSKGIEETYVEKEMINSINDFLETLPEKERNVFMCRYWYMDAIQNIAKRFGYTESKVTSMLHRSRKKLKKHLEKEGWL